MFIPYSTDAPIYHFPKATIGLIAANVIAFIVKCAVPAESIDPWEMILGDGIHPMQWLSQCFLHDDIVHLIGNMIFLWAYGIIVEGKVGPLKFLALYLAIGAAQGAAIQVAYLGASDTSYVLGASGAIFGLMAVCIVWSPMNELNCFYFFMFGFRVFTGTMGVAIWAFGALQLLFESASIGFNVLVKGDPLSSGLLHVSGALFGFVAGIITLKLGLVDCEDWDIFSLWRKERELGKAWKARDQRLELSKQQERLPKSRRDPADRPARSPEERSALLLTKVRNAINVGDLDSARLAYDNWSASTGGHPPRADLMALIKSMQEAGGHLPSVPLMRDYCRLYPEGADRMRLKLAMILVRDRDRPAEAIRVLEPIADGSLPPNLDSARRQLMAEAAAKLEDGVLELEEDLL